MSGRNWTGLMRRGKLWTDFVKTTPTRARVLLADDHTLVAEGIGRLLEDHFDLVATVDNGRKALEFAQRLKPDVVILDISMPQMNGVEATRQLRTLVPETKVILLTMHSDRIYVSEGLRAGAVGYLLKKSAGSELIAAIHQVLAGKIYVTPSVGAEFASAAAQHPTDRPRAILTQRQREVLQLIAEGHAAKSIAHVLNISAKTAEFHRASIMEKLGLRTTAELTRYALDQKMVGSSSEELK